MPMLFQLVNGDKHLHSWGFSENYEVCIYHAGLRVARIQLSTWYTVEINKCT